MKRIALLSLFLLHCSGEELHDRPPQSHDIQPWLLDEASERGVDFSWISGDTGKFNMPEIIGGGAAMLDYDNDGDLDLYFIQGGHLGSLKTESNVLLRNDDGIFTDVTRLSNTGDTGYGMGVAIGDFNNDSFVDIYITNVGENVLLKNNGDGTFEDVSVAARVNDQGWGASASFADFDQDGDLDLYATNYLVWTDALELECFNDKGVLDYCSPTNYMAPARDVLYRNNGDGSFTDLSEPAGIGTRLGTGLGILCNDYTGDGRIDIFVANDGMADQLWMNNGDWTFTDVAPQRGCALDDEGQPKAGMGLTSADFDSDGDLDILVCNITGESDSLHRNEGNFFTDATASQGIRTATRHATRFGLGWVDFDNDGVLDLYEANGLVQQIGTPTTDDPFAEENYLLRGHTNGWTLVKGSVDSSLVHTSRAAVFGDVNNDGGIDVLVINRDAPAYLLMNQVEQRGNFVSLTIKDKHGKPAIGTVVAATLADRRISFPVQSSWSYLAANDSRIHIGLAGETAIEDIKIFWYDGTTSMHDSFGAGFHTISQQVQ
ncbi:MAG: CRTAC1 family protein [Phycisphaerae bacterium]|jgi:enediyne biosynthesis protein E4|nr:CRTAC1 family protein [Phycisphaerae bacterium]